MKIILTVFFFSISLFGAMITGTVTAVDLHKQEALIDTPVKLQKGVSGYIIKQLADDRTIIIKSLEILEQNATTTKVALKDFTMFKHTTPTLTSAYIIKSNKENKESNQFELDIISDIGNKYLMIIDFKDNNVRFVYEKDNIIYMVHHTIKKVWFDDEN